jgi:type VI secretion system protein VasJ
MSYPEKLSAHYLALASAPIPNGNFSGVDVRFSDEFEALEREIGKAVKSTG